jgi:hypothetical protein
MAKYLTTSEITKIKDICRRADVRWEESENGDYTIWKAVESLLDEIKRLEDKVKRLEKARTN